MMKKFILPLLLTSLLFAEISPTKSPVAVSQSFELNNTASNFDNTLHYTHKPLLSCSPELSAVYKINSTSKLKVIPQKPLQASKEYSCSYGGDPFNFKTEMFQLLDAQYFKEEKVLRLSFNDRVDKNSIEKGLTLTKVDKLTTTKLKYTLIQKGEKEFLLKINEKVGSSSIKLSINDQLKTIHGASYIPNYRKTFNETHKELALDPEKKPMSLIDAPQMVSLANGDFALRIFVSDNLTGQSKHAIDIEGIENFQLSDYKYMGHKLRERYEIKNAYYYHDITSKAFKPNTSYKVTLQKGLSSYNRETKEDAHYTLKTGDRAKTIRFDEDQPYISNKGELAFSSVNIDKATLIVERILDDNLRYFMNFDAAQQKKVGKYSKEIFNKELTLNQKKNQLLQQKFKLSDLNKEDLPVGIYKVTLRYEALVDKNIKEYASSKVLFLSNLGITANIGKTEAFVSVFSLDKAQAIKNAKVQLYGANNEIIGEAQTNEDGIAIVTHKPMANSIAKGIMVKKGNDKNFLALNQSINSPSPQQLLQKVERFKAHVYFQSNIVRPKAKINALITIKDRDFISASNLPVKVVFQEQYGKKIREKVYHTDNYGLIDFNYQLDENDKTGNYQLVIYLGDALIGKKLVKVEAFMPPKIENSISTNKERYELEELIDVNISSSYLFGAPASNLQGKVSINARPIDHVDKKFKNYSFSNRALAKKNVNSYIDRSEDIVLDSNGKFSMVMKNTLTQKVPSILEAMLGVTIMDDAQPVSAYKKVKIYPYKTMVGLKINKKSFEKGQKLEGKAVLIDPLTSQTVQRKLFATIKHVEWHYNYADGHYNWEKESSVIDRFTVESNQSFSREINKNGNYILEIADRLGGHSASESFDVFWWNYSNLSPKENLESVEIKIEDKLYNKGDELNIELKSPILEGQLLLTLEGDKVDNYKRLTLNKGVAKTSLKITKDMKRGLRLHATVIRPTNTSSALIPFRATGYQFVKPNRESHKINVEMKFPKSSKSKTVLPITLKTSKPSKVLLCIVDKGILQLVGQEDPKIFEFFNEQPKKQLSYHDLYDQLLSHIAKGKLVDFGAGDMLRSKQKHLAPDLGKRIKPFMIWSSIIDNPKGTVNLKVDIPEFNGKASVVALAINENSVGVSAKEITIKDDVMIKPSYPRYGLIGDNIEVPLRIFNTTQTPKEVQLSSKVSNNLTLSLTNNTLSIPAKSSKVIHAKLLPKAVGKGEISLIAHYGGTTVSNSVELPLHSPYALSTKTFKGITNTKTSFTVPSVYQGAKAYISLSDNLIGALRDDLKYLVSYPYGCAEQTSSKLSAMYYAQAFFTRDELLKDSANFMLQGIKKLHNMQNYYGEFEYWEGVGSISPYASLYTAQTLLEIDETAKLLPKELKKKIFNMLNAVASQSGEYQGEYSKFHQLYAAYILVEHNKLSSSTANMLYEKKSYKGNFLATFYMAAILKATGNVEKGEKLYEANSYELSKYSYKLYGNHSGNFESNVRDMMLHFIIKNKYFNKDAKDLETIQKAFSKLYSTQDKAVALKAISTYLGSPKKSKMDVTVKINGKNLSYKKTKLLTVDKVNSETIEIEPHHGSVSYAIELVKNLPKSIKNKISNNKELSIEQTFINANGAKVDLNNLKQGDKLFSKITVANYGKLEHVVINQRIPACLSIVNNNIQNQVPLFKNNNIYIAHKEIRDDRILYFVNLADKKAYNKALKKEISIENRGILYAPLVASSIGECQLPATIIEAMYDTGINDYAKVTQSIMVKDLKTVAPTSPIAENQEVQKERFTHQAEALVRKLYTKEMNSNNPLAFCKYFDFPLKVYFKSKNFKEQELIANKQKYFKAWSKRTYSNLQTTIEKRSQKPKEAQVKISFDYKLYNGEKVLNGKSEHLVSVIEKNNKLLVNSIELWKKP